MYTKEMAFREYVEKKIRKNVQFIALGSQKSLFQYINLSKFNKVCIVMGHPVLLASPGIWSQKYKHKPI